ncbi:MAG: 50S ribosomal protein L4 [Patescibacteria group bacterium]
MHIDIVNTENKKVGAMELPEGVFGVQWNPELLHQVMTSLTTRKRAPLAHTKGRGDVRGGGKKPWRQKGTGRARHGSTRSPIWVGGGVAFGPTNERNFERKINKKMKAKALYSLLSKKLEEREIAVIDDFGVQEPKTKTFAAILRAFYGDVQKAPRTLFVAAKGERAALLSGRNIKYTSVSYSNGLNILDCLRAKKIIFGEKALKEFIGQQTT